MPRLSRVQVAQACETAARLTKYSPAPQPAAMPTELTSPFYGQHAMAWTNGQTFFAPVVPIPVHKAHPRTRVVTLDSNARVH